MPSVLIIGAGDVGLRIAQGLLERQAVGRLTLADAAPERQREQVEMLRCCYPSTIGLELLDGTDPKAVGRLLRQSQPDLVVQAASLVSPWAIIGKNDPIARALSAAGIAVQLPAQLPVLTTVMTCLGELGWAVPLANLSVPDMAHPILAGRGLAPTIGLGNASILHLRALAALRARAGARAGALPLLRVIGHHNHVYGVMQAEPPADPSLGVRVHLGEDGRRDDALAYQGPAFSPGPIYNVITAVAALTVISALLPGAAPLRFSAPAPFGLPGGYPVRIEGGQVALDLPPGVGRDQAVAFNQAIGRLDGIAEIEADGTVHYTAAARAAVAGLEPKLAEPLKPSAMAARIRLLLEVVGRIA